MAEAEIPVLPNEWCLGSTRFLRQKPVISVFQTCGCLVKISRGSFKELIGLWLVTQAEDGGLDT